MDISVSNNNLDVNLKNKNMNINLGASKVVTHEKNHANLDNLDFENSGHTGFQPAGNYVEDNNYVHTDNNFTDEDKEKLNSLENFSGNAADISYEDNYGYGTENVQDTLDNISDLINNLEGKSIKTLHNTNIDLRTLPIGIYYVTGTSTTFKYTDTKTKEDIITSNTQKVVLIALGEYNSYGKGVIFDGLGNDTRTFLHMFGSGLYNNVNINNLVSTSVDHKITSTWTFNATPRCIGGPIASNHLTNKQYVDNKIRDSKRATDLGYIDLADYGDDVVVFMDTLINDGKYKFVDSYDEFEWYVEVCSTDNYVGQTYWGSEEGFTNQYFRHGIYNWDDDTVEWGVWNNYLDATTANSLYKRKTDVDYVTITVDDLRTWLDEMTSFTIKEYEVKQDTDKHKFIVRANSTSYVENGAYKYIRYQEYYDIEEPNKFYKRTGIASSNTSTSTVTWGDWCVFEESSKLENVLKDILTAIQEGGTTSDTIDEIEKLLVSYFENKTVEEVEA